MEKNTYKITMNNKKVSKSIIVNKLSFSVFLSKKIKDFFEYQGVKYIITGGTTYDGCFMKRGCSFMGFKKIYYNKKGKRYKKRVHGSIITDSINQIFLSVV